MNTPDHLELEQIKLRQRRLQEDLEILDGRIRLLEGRVKESGQATSTFAAPPPLPPVISRAQPAPLASEPLSASVAPPVSPVPIEFRVEHKTESELEQQQAQTQASPQAPAQEPEPAMVAAQQVASSNVETGTQSKAQWAPWSGTSPAQARSKQEASGSKNGSFEMQLGTYWFVRVGIVLLLTAMAFLGTYAYQNFVVKASAGVKVAMMYFAGALMLGAGTWVQRRLPDAKESLRQYGQVLFGGGLAAVYFTTYAAHHFEPLRVIANPVVDAVLLLAWAGFTVWIADRRKSELLAVFGLGLAYYTSMVTRVGWFTLYSNLVLTGASVFFLWRNRWTILGFISLPATYLAYGFWRFYASDQWRLPGVEEHLATSAGFLGAYWLIFTLAVFITRQEQFKGPSRASFLSFNNGAALGLFLLTMAQVRSGGLWKVLLGFGTVLLVLAYLSRRFLKDDVAAEQSYLTQGLVLVTAGFVVKFSGMDLSLLLAMQSVVTLALGIRIDRKILRIGAYIFAAMAVGWLLDGLSAERRTLWLGIGVCAGLLVNTVLVHHQKKDVLRLVREHVSYFIILLLVCVGALLWNHTQRAQMPVGALLITLALMATIYAMRVRELPILAQALFVFAHLGWLANALSRPGPWDPLWQPAVLLLGTLASLHWWQRQQILALPDKLSLVIRAVVSFFLVLLVASWATPNVTPSFERHLVIASYCGIVLLLTVYAAATRVWILAILAQILLVPAGILSVEYTLRAVRPWAWSIVVPATFIILSAGTRFWLTKTSSLSEQTRNVVLVTARVYTWIAAALIVFCVSSYVPAIHRPWTFALLSLVSFGIAGLKGRGDWFPISVMFIICGLVAYVSAISDSVWAYWPNVLLAAALFAQQRVARRMSGRYPLDENLHKAAILLGCACLWMLLSRYVAQNLSGFLITVSWSILALALFATGILLRERFYRWSGLAVLAGALGRIVIFDVWKLNTIYRILSFMALGVVLVLLGYFYNRYQEKIKELL